MKKPNIVHSIWLNDPMQGTGQRKRQLLHQFSQSDLESNNDFFLESTIVSGCLNRIQLNVGKVSHVFSCHLFQKFWNKNSIQKRNNIKQLLVHMFSQMRVGQRMS